MHGLPDWFQYGDEPAFPKSGGELVQESFNTCHQVMTHRPYPVEAPPQPTTKPGSIERYVCDSMNTIITNVKVAQTIRMEGDEATMINEHLDLINKSASAVLRKIQEGGRISPPMPGTPTSASGQAPNRIVQGVPLPTTVTTVMTSPPHVPQTIVAAATAPAPPSSATVSVVDESMTAVDAQSLPSTRPCSHNNWDNVRARKGSVTLRCRSCQSQWRVPLHLVRRCPNFDTPRGCRKTTSCNKLHVHRSKQSLSERVESFGGGVLQKVPLHARPDPEAVRSSTPTPPPLP
eukprot:TRINITY_DN5520_c0_g2_i1.p1 TRINITY_DN5520_c0_g2~~TRINITY_DN5520_c0_g2_i1.p1  ORF type:complete len:290 (+),score=56.97 TRINITY_DN5520_c0_g2_i1:39-908(+)